MLSIIESASTTSTESVGDGPVFGSASSPEGDDGVGAVSAGTSSAEGNDGTVAALDTLTKV